MNDTLRLVKAVNGGYFVTNDSGYRSELPFQFLFAGNLKKCLKYIETEMDKLESKRLEAVAAKDK